VAPLIFRTLLKAYGNIDGANEALKKRPKKSVMPPSGNKGNSKCSRQKAWLKECSNYTNVIDFD
jgi:hypothetical protein